MKPEIFVVDFLLSMMSIRFMLLNAVFISVDCFEHFFRIFL